MRYRAVFLAAVAGVACSAIAAFAAEQTIAGKTFLVQDASSGADPTKRKISVIGKEKNSPNSLVGDPTQTGSEGGAFLEIFADGANTTSQEFMLPQGTSSTGKAFWSGDVMKGFTYKDSKGDQGPVKSVRIKRSGSGSFSVKIKLNGKGGPLAVVPPNPGTDGCAALTLGQSAGTAAGIGDRYSLQFGAESTIENSGAKLFRATMPTVEGVCAAVNPPVPCGASPFPTCGGFCPGGDVCGGVQGPDPPGECACLPPGSVCSGSQTFSCTSPMDCDAQLPGWVSSDGGPLSRGAGLHGRHCAHRYVPRRPRYLRHARFDVLVIATADLKSAHSP